MPITAAEVTTRIIETRAKLAIYRHMMDIMRANYLPVESAGAEASVARDDGGSCTEEHFLAVLEEFEDRCGHLVSELERWESLTFEPVAEVSDMVEAAAKRRGMGGKVGGRRIHQASGKP